MKISRSAFLNVLVFFVSMIAFWYTSKNAVFSMFFFETVALFIAVVHRTRREILAPIAIFIGFKMMTLPISLVLFTSDTIIGYLLSVIVLDMLLAFSLGRLYRSESLRRFFKVDTPSRLIPQVLAMISVLGIGVVHHLIVLGEVVLFQSSPSLFSGMPFFYTHYEGVKIVIKGLLLLAIWSMCLDSYFVDYERYRRLTGVVKTN